MQKTNNVFGWLTLCFVIFLYTVETRADVYTVTNDSIAVSDSGQSVSAPQINVVESDESGLEIRVQTPQIAIWQEEFQSGSYVRVGWDNMAVYGKVGEPAIPVLRKLIYVPQGASVELQVKEHGSVKTCISAKQATAKLIPNASKLLTKSPSAETGEANLETDSFVYEQAQPSLDEAAYSADSASPIERAALTRVGMVRGMQSYLLEVRPVAYNPQRDELVVWPVLDISVKFKGEFSQNVTNRSSLGLDRIFLNAPQPTSRESKGSGNYLIVAAEDFVGGTALSTFITAKTQQGFTVSTYEVRAGTNRTTIKAYIESLWGTPNAPDYILLVGDAIEDTPTSTSNTVPVWMSATNWTKTDIPYACMDGAGDWHPDISIGRFPVRLESELAAVVDKTLHVENGVFADPTYLTRAIFMSSPDPLADAEGVHNDRIDTYMTPNGINSQKLYYETYGARTEDVANAVNNGCFFAAYYGHSTLTQLNAPRFTADDVAALNNNGMYPFVISFSCLAGQFHFTTPESGVLETWLRAPGKGASACFGSIQGLKYTWDSWDVMYDCLLKTIYDNDIRELGAAVIAAKELFVAHYGPDDPISAFYMNTFSLLGDPSMRLPQKKDNYLIITPSLYVDSKPLSDMIALKEGQGLKVSVHEVASGTSNGAIKSYIEGLWGTVDEPKYVLIVGDTDGDTAGTNTIPHFVGEGDKHATTDLPYVCMDGSNDWYPDIAIGRFSVRTVDQLDIVVEKTATVQKGVFTDPDYVKRATFLANSDTANTAEPTHDWVSSNYLEPLGYTPTKVYASEGGTGAQAIAAVNAGSLFTVYMGHSSSDHWWDPQIYDTDVNAMTNTGLYGLVFGWSCSTAHYEYDECFAEVWQRADKKGAAAYISASTYIYWGSVEAWRPSAIHEKSFFAAFFEDDIWEVGPAWQAGLYRFLRDYGKWDGNPAHGPTENADVCRNFFEEFLVLGDPALPLPQPSRFTLKALSESQNICTTVEDEAIYIIETGSKAGFDEVVTLSTANVPAGLTVDFHANGLTPPYSSRLTLGNVDSLSNGRYTFTVNATASGGTTKALELTLGVSNTSPGNVVLSSPANGASEVSRTPLLQWQAAAAAQEYQVQVAVDSGFSNILLDATTADTSLTVSDQLDTITPYHWRVKPINGCGTNGFSSPFSFTTLDQPDYFTERFTSNIDFDNTTVVLKPDGSGDYYEICKTPITELPTDPSGGTAFSFVEDGVGQVDIGDGRKFGFYGVDYNRFFVCENGFVTFTSGTSAWEETLEEHFSMPRISALYDDLSVSHSGTVSWKQLADRMVVTWEAIPEYQTVGANTFQVELFFNGEIHLSYLGVSCGDSIVGLSAGPGSIPGDFLASDLSSAESCSQNPSFVVGAVPDSVGVCAGSDTVFTLYVQPVAGFSEPVTLALIGQPAGLVADFDTNNRVPPFNSVLTISNTSGCTPGTYFMEVNGTASGGIEQSENVQLSIESSVPAQVTLQGPRDGATDISMSPTLTWNAVSSGDSYTVEISTNSGFTNIVYLATTTETSHVVGTVLEANEIYYWKVTANNACGVGQPSAIRSFQTEDTLSPVSYDMPNGQAGTYSYFDDSYDGNGDNSSPLAPLSGGLGDLTDGVIATEHWNTTSEPYVGWSSIDPTITFHFASTVNIQQVTLYVDDAGGGGGVQPPANVTLTMGDHEQVFPVTDPAGDEPFAIVCDATGFIGDTIEVTLADGGTSSNYMMLSEVMFRGESAGACCDGETCSLSLESDCIADGGEYLGNGSNCDPNPCKDYEAACLIISEVVQGTESGDCPRWLEIVNTGTSDFAFIEGGLIVQADDSTDVNVDVDLSGITIPAGEAFVLNSNFNGACTGAFGIYPADPDMSTDVKFGFGNERLILTDTADGSNIIDIYGEFGVNGAGKVWEFTDGYSYRLSRSNSAAGADFDPTDWFFGGAGVLNGSDPTQLLLDNTTPDLHVVDRACTGLPAGDIDSDGDVDLDDFAIFASCMYGPGVSTLTPPCTVDQNELADLDYDGDVDLQDFSIFQKSF